MGKGKSCDAATRKAILELHQAKRSYQQIANQMKCSKTMVFNAIQHSNAYQTTENVPRKRRPRKTSERDDRMIVRMAKKNPRISSTEIKRKISAQIESPISARTIRRRLVEGGLHGRISRKKPLVTEKQRKKRIQFAKSHASWTANQWKYIVWSDETKINRIGQDGARHVRRPKSQAFRPKYVIPVVKHGGGSINVWGCFSWNGVGPIHRIEGILTAEKYVDILRDVLVPWADENMPVIWKFQQDNDPKHTARLTKRFFDENAFDVLEWAASSPDLNPIEHLWGDVKNAVAKQNNTNMNVLWTNIQAAWNAIPIERCRRLIESMPRRCLSVLKQKGFATKY